MKALVVAFSAVITLLLTIFFQTQQTPEKVAEEEKTDISLPAQEVEEEVNNSFPSSASAQKLSAQEIGDRFVFKLTEATFLQVDSEQKLELTAKDSNGKTIRHREVIMTISSIMEPDLFSAKFYLGYAGESYAGEQIRDFPLTLVGKDKIAPGIPVEGALIRELNTPTCAGGEFTGTWVGGSPIGHGWSIGSEATLSIDPSDESQYRIEVERYSFRDEEGDFLKRKDTLWYDHNFYMVKRLIELSHIYPDGSSSEHTITATYSYSKDLGSEG